VLDAGGPAKSAADARRPGASANIIVVTLSIRGFGHLPATGQAGCHFVVKGRGTIADIDISELNRFAGASENCLDALGWLLSDGRRNLLFERPGGSDGSPGSISPPLSAAVVAQV
jgi:hypothetical protein